MIPTRKLRRLLLVAAVTAAPALSLAVAASSSPTPTAQPRDLACVWVGQLNTGVCVVAPTNTAG